MCGIAGVAGDRDPGVVYAAVQAAVSSMARRGPDSEGILAWPKAVLGHRRLAILDLSDAGKQPMVSEDGSIGLVFNGCIYNFEELRRDLESRGHRFRSRTDTEVILHGYRQWGIHDLAKRLRGMFAFGIWDDREHKLFLVRDRLGVKPLVFAASNGSIAFASTVAALRDAGFAEVLNADAMLEFLEFGWVSDDLCIYSGLRKVPPATIVEWQDGRLQEHRYWTLPEAGSRKIRFEEAVEETERLLLESVKLRLIADVPVGSLLSGGIDSALIAWALSKLNVNLKSFTVSTPGHPADEARLAADTARQLGVPHEIIELSPSEQPALNDLVSAYAEPFACPSALGMLEVCKAVKPKVTVLLTGDGGDDIFLGYTHHRNFLLAQKMARLTPAFLANAWPTVRPLVERVSGLHRFMHLVDYATGGLGAVTRTHDGLPYFAKRGMLGGELATRLISHRQIPLSFASARHLMKDFLDYEWRTRFVAEYMTKVDGAAMYYAMEARSPFLDQVLWEFAASLPYGMRLQNGELKAVLRALARRNVGVSVAQRKKQGFTIPVGHWLTTTWRQQLDAITGDSLLGEDGWIAKQPLREAVADALERKRAPLQMWSLVVLENWLRCHRKAAVPVAG